MDTRRRIDADSTSILRRYVEDQTSMNFHFISTYFFDVILLIEKSPLFPRTFFNVILMVKKSNLFPRTFINVISLVQISTFFPRTFFNAVSMVEKSSLFACIFFDEISMARNSTSLLIKLQVNENVKVGFPLLVTLKS